MGKCQFFKIYKDICPPEIFTGSLIGDLSKYKCELDCYPGEKVCYLHLPKPDKGYYDTIKILGKGYDDLRIPMIPIGLFYFFPVDFTFSRFLEYYAIKNSNWSLHNCIFFSDPFKDLKICKQPHMPKRFTLNHSKFIHIENEIELPEDKNMDFFLSNCKFMSIELNGKRYPNIEKPSLKISGGTSSSEIHLNNCKIAGSLLIRNLRSKVDFGYSNPKVREGSQLEVENLSISGDIFAPLEMRFIKVNNRFSMETATFCKHVVMEHIQNKLFVANRCHFVDTNGSSIRGLNFKEGLFFNTNIFDVQLREVQWESSPIHGFASDYAEILYQEKLKEDKRTENEIKKNVYPTYYKNNWKELEELYRLLKSNYQKQGYSILASNFHYREMYCKRKDKGWWGFNLNTIYGVLSCYGNSVLRSTLILLVIMLIPGFFYASSKLFCLSGYLENLEISCFARFAYSFLFSIKNSLLLKPDFLIPTSWFGEFLRTFQSILSPIQIFLVGFTMRRRIKF